MPLQVTSCFWTAFTVPWPTNVGDLFKFSAILKVFGCSFFLLLLLTLVCLQADIFTIQTISCLSRDWDRIGKLLFYTVTPPLLVVVLGLPIRLASIIYVSHHKIKSPEFKLLKAKFCNAVRWIYFVEYAQSLILIFFCHKVLDRFCVCISCQIVPVALKVADLAINLG